MNFPDVSKRMEFSVTHCPAEEVMLDYTAGRLDRAQSALFERHAENCARCAAFRAAQAAVWQSLDEWRPMPVSAGFNRELWRRIDAEERTSWRRHFAVVMGGGFWKQVAPLAVAVALIVTGFVLDHSTGRPEKQPANAAASIIVTASDADQLERTLDDIQLLHEVDAESAKAEPDSKLM